MSEEMPDFLDLPDAPLLDDEDIRMVRMELDKLVDADFEDDTDDDID